MDRHPLLHYSPDVDSRKHPVVRLSIVIPVLGKLKKLEDTLVSVLENRPSHCEIVVVLNEPYDDPYELAGEVRFVDAPRHAELIDCLNLGVAASHGEIIHTLCCGIEVSNGWTEAVLNHFDHSDVAAVTTLVVDRANPDQSLSTGLAYRPGGAAWRLGFRRSLAAKSLKMPSVFGPDLLAGFFRKSTWEAVGGLCSQFQGSLAGLDLALALHFTGGKCIQEPSCRVFADRSDLPEGEQLGSGSQAERLFWRWAPRMGLARSFANHVGLLANECLECIVRPLTIFRLFGRAWGTVLAPLQSQKNPRPAAVDIPEEPILARPHFLQSLEKNPPIKIGKAS